MQQVTVPRHLLVSAARHLLRMSAHARADRRDTRTHNAIRLARGEAARLLAIAEKAAYADSLRRLFDALYDRLVSLAAPSRLDERTEVSAAAEHGDFRAEATVAVYGHWHRDTYGGGDAFYRFVGVGAELDSLTVTRLCSDGSETAVPDADLADPARDFSDRLDHHFRQMTRTSAI